MLSFLYMVWCFHLHWILVWAKQIWVFLFLIMILCCCWVLMDIYCWFFLYLYSWLLMALKTLYQTFFSIFFSFFLFKDIFYIFLYYLFIWTSVDMVRWNPEFLKVEYTLYHYFIAITIRYFVINRVMDMLKMEIRFIYVTKMWPFQRDDNSNFL